MQKLLSDNEPKEGLAVLVGEQVKLATYCNRGNY